MGTPDSGWDLGVDFWQLSMSARVLDDAGTSQSTAASTLNGADDAAAFSRSTQLTGDANGAYPYWVALRNALVSTLNSNATTLHGAADAMRLCVKDYATQDTEAHKDFKTISGNLTYVDWKAGRTP